ncbi:MAG TPA: hypothetical protein VFB75_01145 [Burkholderiales bacterium]|nr:hypothetical protein [Burkholderiales bacterium]
MDGDNSRRALALLRIRRAAEGDKLNLDIFWLEDKSLADSENLHDPDVLAQEIIDDLEDALAQLRSVASELR